MHNPPAVQSIAGGFVVRRNMVYDKINADAFMMQVAPQLGYARNHGRKYDKKIN